MVILRIEAGERCSGLPSLSTICFNAVITDVDRGFPDCGRTAAIFVAGSGYLVMSAVFAATSIFYYGSFSMRRFGRGVARPALSPGMVQDFRLLCRIGSFSILFACGALVPSAWLCFRRLRFATVRRRRGPEGVKLYR